MVRATDGYEVVKDPCETLILPAQAPPAPCWLVLQRDMYTHTRMKHRCNLPHVYAPMYTHTSLAVPYVCRRFSRIFHILMAAIDTRHLPRVRES